MRNHKAFLLAAIVLMGSSIAGADLILTLNGNDLSDSPLISSMGQFLVAVEGSTQIEPNHVSLGAVGGVLEPVPDANNEYYFEFDPNSNEATISLVTAIDMVIDGNSIPAGATIYQLLIFCNRQQNIFGAGGIGLDELIWSEGQSASGPDSSTLVASEDAIMPEKATLSDAVTTRVPWIEALASGRPTQQEERVLLDCPVDTSESKREESEAERSDPVSAEHADTPEPASTGSSGGGLMTMGTDSVIEVSGDITSNQIWNSANTYHIITDVNVQALLVIEPGTMVAFGPEKGLFVNNGGALVSCGTPDNPVIYTSDSQDPWYGDYSCAVFVEETASLATKITYSHIEYAYAGIVISNRRLDAPIENNYFFNNAYGIVEHGIEHTDISNNLIVASYYSGIEIFLESATAQADANSHILIQNNTCDYYQDCGITVHGVPNIDDAGLVILANNIVSESYQYALNLVDGYMYATVLNTGYYDNANNKNWEFEETDPVVETQWPYQTGTGWLPICYLEQGCGFIDAGAGSIEDMQLINKTTDVNGLPDRNVSDIGFHYSDSDFSNSGDSNSLAADFDKSMRVNFEDLAIFANVWQQSTQGPEDLDGNGFVDFNDLSIFCGQWLGILPLGVRLDQAPNLVSDVLLIELVWPADELSYYLFMDAEYLGQFLGGDMEIPTYEYRNGIHQVKVVGVSLDDEILVAPAINITVNNRLQCLTGTEAYKYNHAYQFGGFYEPNDGSTIDLTIKDLDENVIWSTSSSGNFNLLVPAGVLQGPYNELAIQELAGRGSGTPAGDSWPASWIKEIVKEFDVINDPCCANARSLLVGVDGGVFRNWPKDRKAVWTEYLTACRKGNFAPTICLFFGQATRENIKTAMGLSRVKSFMIITDGGRKVGETHRTFFQAADGPYFSYLKRNWSGAPNDYEPLPDKYEEKGYSVCDLRGSFDQRNKMYVFIDACKNGPSVMDPVVYDICSATPQDNDYSEEEYWKTSDMATVFDIVPDMLETRLYMGWRGFAFKGNPLLRYNSFLWDIWYQAGSRGKSFAEAISDAATYETGNCEVYVNFSWVGNTNIFFNQ